MGWIWEFLRRLVRRAAGCPTGILSVTPQAGPTGTFVTITVTGLRARATVTVQIPPGTLVGDADAQGTYTTTLQVFENEPRRVPITVIYGQGLCRDRLRSGFTVT